MSRINGNAYKLCFWILAYALHDPNLLNNLRKETSPAIHEKGVHLDYLLDNCPYLEAVYNEVLRLTASSSTVRSVTHATDLHDIILSPGNIVLIPSRQLHFDENAFGSDASQFRPERFLEDKYLSRNPSFRPFGGGTTYCPGRFLARREVITFIALFLHRFEVSLTKFDKTSKIGSAERIPFPKIEEMKPCLGIMGPAEGEDIEVYVRRATLNFGSTS